MKDNKFKIIFIGVFGIFILLGFLAFSTYRGKNSAAQDVTVTIWGTMNSGIFNNFITKYAEDNGTQLKVNYVQMDKSEIYPNILEAIVSNRTPDVILVGQELIKTFYSKIYPLPAATISQRTFEDSFVQEASIYERPDGIFGIPFYLDPLVMYWNKDTFFAAGIATPPKTWAEFPLLVGKLTKSDANANVTKSAVSFGEYSNVNNAKAILSTLILQTGNPIVSTTMDGSFISTLYNGQFTGGTASAVNFYMEYSNPKKSVYSWNRSLPNSQSSFLSEDLATYFGFASEASSLRNKNPNLNFDVAFMPQIVDAKSNVTFGELYGFALLKSSPNIAAAFNLVSTLTSAPAIKTLTSISYFTPARKDVISAGTADAQKTIFYNSALIARGWLDPDSDKTDEIFQNMIEDISSGKGAVSDTLDRSSVEINNLL